MSELKAGMKILLVVLGTAALWLILAVPGAAIAFIFGRWCAKLLGWY